MQKNNLEFVNQEPTFFYDKIYELKHKLPIISNDYVKNYVAFKKMPSNNEYNNAFNNISNNLKSLNTELLKVNSDVERNIDKLNNNLTVLKNNINENKDLYEKNKNTLDDDNMKQTGSVEMLNNFKTWYELNIVNNILLSFGIVGSFYILKKSFS